MRLFITILLALSPSARASPQAGTDNAAALLSRFEPGAMPKATGVVSALNSLADFGSAEHLPLLNSLASEEQYAIQVHARAAIKLIAQRERQANRNSYQRPGHKAVTVWLSQHEPVGPAGERLGRNERHAVAYTALVLAESIGPSTLQWRDLGERLELEGRHQEAIRLYVTAALRGEDEAFANLTAFGLDTERLMLGVYTALPSDHSAKPLLLSWLVREGGITAVRVFAERIGRSEAIERATTLDALSKMIQAGRLNTGADSAARRRIASSQSDPDSQVREFARTTYATLEPR
jgi:hypothetical protein